MSADERRQMEMAAVIDREEIADEVRERIAQDLERLAGIAVDPREALAYFSAARIARDGTR